METGSSSHIMTLVNSIIGVSILAMPFCYKQCGILLASLILIFSNLMTRLSCHYLLKSAIMTRRRSYELLAFHALGRSGKTVVELSIILLMIGTCIAFFVVMGDLGPAIIGSLLRVDYSTALRPAVLIGLAVFVVLPLGLLRNVDSLSSICTASFMFYLLLVLKVFIESMDNLFLSPWTDEVHFWRPAGLLQCLPIFSMALSCQTQLLEIFDSVQNGTLDKMNSIVKSAVNLCTALYMSVGFLGYVAYYKTSFGGNLLMSFSESHFSEFIKLGFVLSVAVTFPLVIFPCRTSLYSLLFKKVLTPHYELVTGGGNHIPESQFKCITFFIITASLIVGLLAPNIEIVLGLLGSTIGVIICILCPPFIFMWISTKATTEKALARMMCIFGLFIMVMGTYANLYLSDSASNDSPPVWKNSKTNIIEAPVDLPAKHLDEKEVARVIQIDNQVPLKANENDIAKEQKSAVVEGKKMDVRAQKMIANKEDKRVEPPIPQDPEAQKAPSEVKKSIDAAVEQNVDVDVNKNVPDEKVEPNASKNEKSRKLSPKLSNNSRALKSPKFSNAPKSANENKLDLKPVELQPSKLKEGAGAVPAELSTAQKLAGEQPPLPLLVKGQTGSHVKAKSVVQRDAALLDKPAVFDREKRDLEHVNNLTDLDAKNSFMQKVAERNNAEEVCEKSEDEMKKEAVAPLKSKSDAVNEVVVVAKPSTVVENIEQNNLEKPDSKVANQSTKVTSKESDKISEPKENFIISPSKLTDPAVRLHEGLQVEEKPSAVFSVSRELKNIEKEAEHRKK